MFDEQALHAVVGFARFFEVLAHVVELAAEDAEFVVRQFGDARVVVAFGDVGGGAAQGAQRVAQAFAEVGGKPDDDERGEEDGGGEDEDDVGADARLQGVVVLVLAVLFAHAFGLAVEGFRHGVAGLQVEGVFGFVDDGEDGDGVFAVVFAVFEVFLFVGGVEHGGGAGRFYDEFAGIDAAVGDDGALQVKDGEFERAGLAAQWFDVGNQRRLVHVAHCLAQDAGLFECLSGTDGDGGAGQLQGVVKRVVDAGVEDFAEVVGEVLPAEGGDDGGGDDGGGEDAPAVVEAEAAFFFAAVVAGAADDLPEGDEA